VALILVAAVVCIAVRRRPGRWADGVAAFIAIGIVVAELSWQPYVLTNHQWSAASSLPVQLCDVGGFIAALALVTRQALLVEVAYFWGLGGTAQALLTPDLRDHFPSFPYIQFYATHDLVVLAALLLVIGYRVTPRAGAVRRIFLLTVGFTLTIAGVDLVTGGNYMYLRQIPAGGSLLNLLGPWPWYIVGGVLLAVLALVLLDAPFALRRHRRQ
jgi:hypothetical integral membrane protein (TIGR02206 family)